jgi:diguanylate cyclase (GGDEF)-like protein
LLLRLDALLGAQRRGVIWAICLALIALDFAGDVLTGAELSWSIFYIAPVAIAAWYLGWGPALLMVGLAAASWLAADRIAGATYELAGVQYWNMLVRAAMFFLVAYTLTLLKGSLAHAQETARTDWLTGLPNTRSFLETAAHEIARARRTHSPLTLAYIDLDGFKAVNDTLGHAAGDELLQKIADALRSRLRDVDVIARLGGDEFAVLFPDTSKDEAERAIERLHPAMDDVVRAGGWPVRFSIGAVTHTLPPDTDELIRQADAAMYEAKRQGGDRAICLDRSQT